MSDLKLRIDGRVFDGGADGNAWITRDSLDGWWDSCETTFDDELYEDRHGAFEVDEVFLGPRRVTTKLLVESSSWQWAAEDIRPWAASLAAKRDIGFAVYEAGEWLSLRDAKIRGKVRVAPHPRDMRRTTVELTAWSADGRKYGAPRRVPIDAIVRPSGGLEFPLMDRALDFGRPGEAGFPSEFAIKNPGTAPFIPSFSVRGRIGSFRIVSGDDEIFYDTAVPANRTLVLSSYLGGRAYIGDTDVSQNLRRADWAQVAPGSTRAFVFQPTAAYAGSQLLVEHPRGAWH